MIPIPIAPSSYILLLAVVISLLAFVYFSVNISIALGAVRHFGAAIQTISPALISKKKEKTLAELDLKNFQLMLNISLIGFLTLLVNITLIAIYLLVCVPVRL